MLPSALRKRGLRCFLAAGLMGSAQTVGLGAEPGEEYQKEILPILDKHCFECHGPEKQKADLNLALFSDLASVTAAPEIWQNVFERVQSFEMPPSTSPDLGFTKHQRLMKWLRAIPKPEKPDCDQIASDRTANFYRGYVMSRRLNREEYNRTVRDLFGVDLELEKLLPADGGGGEGFDTAGSALFTSPIHIEKYLEAADRVARAVLPEFADDLPFDPPEALSWLPLATPENERPPRVAASETIASLARRAFRRPVSEEEVEHLLSMFDRGWRRGDGYIASLRLALKAVLISPHFLFLAEPEPDTGGVHRLGALPLASKLSYFLWSSAPDESLLALAESGELARPEIYLQQVRRLLADPKAEALGQRFALQWLDLERLGTEVHPDPKKFPEFDAELSLSMRQEVVAFFNHLFRGNRSLLELIDSDYTFVNARLAQLYGLEPSPAFQPPPAAASALRQIKWTHPNRGGIVGMAAVHAATSYPARTSPVLRGKWILESLLGDKIKPPPPNVPALEEPGESSPLLTLRARLEAHRANPECASCHDKMDPLGFGLENFDLLGRWRDADFGQPIDAAGTLPSGQTFTGPAGLKSILMARKDDVMKHLVKKMAGFAFGRELNRFDECVVDRTVRALRENGYQASVLIEQIAISFPFQHRFYPKNE